MAAVSELRQPTPQDLSTLRDKMGRHMVQFMQDLVKRTQRAMKENDFHQGVWSPRDLIDAARTSKNPAFLNEVERLRDQSRLLDGWLSEKFWEPIKLTQAEVMEQTEVVVTPRKSWSFKVKEGVDPWEAINQARNGLSLLDCGSVCRLAQYYALFKTLGVVKARRLFQEVAVNTTYSLIDKEDQPMRYFVDFTTEAKLAVQHIVRKTVKKNHAGSPGSRPIRFGQIVSFNGVKCYQKKHPVGMGANFNVICLEDALGKQRFIGHGLPAEGLTEEGLAALMVNEYNKCPDHASRIPLRVIDVLKIVKRRAGSEEYETHTVSEKNPLTQVGGYDPGSPQDFNVRLIWDLMHTSEEQLSLEYVKRHVFATKV